MPETYTQDQIHNIATALYGWTALPRVLPSAPGTGPDWDIGADIRVLLSALSTAERERDALKAQVAEIEARLQGAADRGAVGLHDFLQAGIIGGHLNKTTLGEMKDAIRAAILGEKKED